jgi:hypothetical protein
MKVRKMRVWTKVVRMGIIGGILEQILIRKTFTELAD